MSAQAEVVSPVEVNIQDQKPEPPPAKPNLRLVKPIEEDGPLAGFPSDIRWMVGKYEN